MLNDLGVDPYEWFDNPLDKMPIATNDRFDMYGSSDADYAFMKAQVERKDPPSELLEVPTSVTSPKPPEKKEDKAYDYVVSQLKKKYGDGVLTKRDKIKPQSPAEKAKVRAHQAKVDKENAAERAKDPSQGRYPKGYSNIGSD